MRLLKYPFVFAVLAFALSACQEPIELELEDNVPELVVEGYLAQRDYAIPEEGVDCGGGLALSGAEIQLATATADAFLLQKKLDRGVRGHQKRSELITEEMRACAAYHRRPRNALER